MNLSRQKIRGIAAPFIAITFFVLALWIVHHSLKPYHLQDIRQAFYAVPAARIIFCLLLSCCSYALLTGYDYSAIRYLGKKLAYKKIAFASFLSYAVANNTGSLSILTSSSVRFRLYGSWDFSGIEISTIIGFCTVSLWLGLAFLSGVVLLFDPIVLPPPFDAISPLIIRLIGTACLVPVAGYLLLSVRRRQPLQIYKWQIGIPDISLALTQFGVAILDLLCAGAALYILLPDSVSISIFLFLGIYIVALTVGLVSYVPGGLGVFEGTVLLMLGRFGEGSGIIGALLVYRLIYYLLPLIIAAVTLGIVEMYRRRVGIARLAAGVNSIISALTPQVMAFTVFAAGAILLFSGTLPASVQRIEWLGELVPLAVLELSHFLNSIVGSCLLVLAIGLQRRLDMAFVATTVLLSAGMVFSVFRGGNYEESILLAVVLFALYNSREQFTRKASLVGESFSVSWFSAILLVMVGAVWLGFFAYRHQEYSMDLWWRFALESDAPRFMRAMVGAFGVVFFLALLYLFRPSQPDPQPATADDISLAESIIEESHTLQGYLALLGDKSLLFSEAKNAFIMYGVKGRSWIAMGDPIGERQSYEEVLWRFKDMCEEHGGRPVFYEIGKDNLNLYIDLGLKIIKIGEEGRVALQDFTLAGRRHKELRYIHNRLTREGLHFEVLSPVETGRRLGELAQISRAWLAHKKAAEKGFSLGFFSDDYLRRLPAAIISNNDRILAFANLWPGGKGMEISIDLMRYLPEAPRGVMDFLFIAVMLWAREQGYRWFSFGMAPLAGLEGKKSVSLWSNIGAFVYRHGEHFYNFQGLRQYKDKFDPVWEPRYLAYAENLALPAVFVDLTSLIGGGFKAAARK